MLSVSDFMKKNFDISDIVLCAKVIKGTPRHRNRASHGLVFYPEGESVFKFTDGKTVTAKPGSVVYLPKGSDYNVIGGSGGCYAINFQLSESFACVPFSVQVKNPAQYLELFRHAQKEYSYDGNGSVMRAKSHLCAIIGLMQYEFGLGYINEKNRSVISPAIERIHEVYASGAPTISELAKMCGVTPEYFRMLFKKEKGISPLKYINNLRLDCAMRLLSSGMYSVAEASEMSGFYDTSYFSREFRKHFGVPPSKVCKD